MRGASDVLEALARQRVIKASAELEVELSQKGVGSWLVIMVGRWKERAAEAMVGLVFLDFNEPADRVKGLLLQNEVKRYDDMVQDLRSMLTEGIAYDREQTETERNDLLDILMQAGPRGEQEAIALGLVEGPPPDL